jgi:hypothetical protein
MLYDVTLVFNVSIIINKSIIAKIV